MKNSIQQIMDELHPPILSIPGMGVHSAAMILAEIGDFSNFDSPDKVLAYAGCSPSTYQSGKLTNCYAHMEKRGSRYLRYALYNATKYVCHWNPVFAEYLAKKRSEGKHYNVAPVPCHEETRAADLCLAKVWKSVSYGCLIFSRA